MSTPFSPAERLYRAGIDAFQHGDPRRARAAWVQAVRLDPRHAPAWLALVTVAADPGEQLYCLHRAGVLLPGDRRVREAYREIKARFPQARERPLPEVASPAEKPHAAADRRAAPADDPFAPALPARKPIRSLDTSEALRQAARLRKKNDEEAALQIYLDILREDPAQQEATAEAVQILSRRKQVIEAIEVLEGSLIAGNRDPGALISLAELQLHIRSGNPWGLLEDLRAMPDVKAAQLLRAANLYWKYGQDGAAFATLHEAEQRDPHHQPTLLRLAELYRETGQDDHARAYFQRTVDLGARTEAGKTAQDILLEEAPYIPRFVQTHLAYTLREVLGVAILFLLLAALDAGLDFARIGAAGWVGVGVSVLGGYLAVTATSSPAQGIFAPLLREPGKAKREDQPRRARGSAPPSPSAAKDEPLPVLPMPVRVLMGAVGGLLLILATALVLQHSLASTQVALETVNQGRVPDVVLDLVDQLSRIFGP